MTATMLVSLLGQPRIFYQMALDGLLFKVFSKTNKNGVPHQVNQQKEIKIFVNFLENSRFFLYFMEFF